MPELSIAEIGEPTSAAVLGQSENASVFAADLGGTHLRAALVDREGSIQFRIKHNTPKEETPEAIVSALIAAVHECEIKAQGRISAVSVVVPGTVNVEQGTVVKAPNLPSLDGLQLPPRLRDKLRLPALLENDANAAAVGEMWRGAGRGRSSIVCVTLGTGVGGGEILKCTLWW